MRFYVVFLILLIGICLASCREHSAVSTINLSSESLSDVTQMTSASDPQIIRDQIVTTRTFTLTLVWSQPLIGVDTMALLPEAPPKVLVPCEGNVVAILNLHGKLLQKILPKELENSIIMNIQAVNFSGKQRIGIVTLDGKFYLFDESFEPIAAYNVESEEHQKGTISDFQFMQHREEELFLLGIQQGQDDAAMNSVIHAVDLQGLKRWECPFEGMLNQISSAIINDQIRALVSCTVSQDQDLILVFSSDGAASDPVSIVLGRRVLWFQVLDSTIYALLSNTDGDVRFVGFDLTGKGQWSRLLPTGEYEVEPMYMPKEKKWFVPSPSGEIFVFDLIGNMIDTFSLDVVPTGLLCVNADGETLLIVTDGETVLAWQVHPRIHF